MKIDYQSHLYPCDIIIVYNKRSFLHKIICWITRKEAKNKAGHIAINLENGLMVEANALGVRVKNLKNYSKRKYVVYIVTKSNTIIELTDSINYEVKRNISRDLITGQVKKNQNENPGIRNDPKTAGDFYNEKNIRNRARRKRATNSVENIVNNTSIVIE